jgi:hypothetical protein
LLPHEILHEGLVAGVRSLVWFAAFALLEGILWSGVDRVRALAAGVAALLLYLTVAGGGMVPSLAQPMWVLIALGLNAAVPKPIDWPRQAWLGYILPLPVFTALGVAYALMMFAPGITVARLFNEARGAARNWRILHEPEWRRKLDEQPTPQAKLKVTERSNAYLENQILKRLVEAQVSENSQHADTLVQLAYWTGKQWELYSEVKGFDPKLVNDWNQEMKLRRKQLEIGDFALRFARRAQLVDPAGKDGYWAEYQLRVVFSRQVSSVRKQQYGLALEILRKLWDIDPHDENLRAELASLAALFRHDVQEAPDDPQLRYLLADVLFQQRDVTNGKDQARTALQRDQQTSDTQYKLTDPQREQIKAWLGQS